MPRGPVRGPRLSKARPGLCSKMRDSITLGKRTPVHLISTTPVCKHWYNAMYFEPSRDVGKRPHSKRRRRGNGKATVWKGGLFALLATSVLSVLSDKEALRRSACTGFGNLQLIALVCSAGLLAMF